MNRLRMKLTYANVMATIAVFIALGGASYAAVKLPSNSVGTKQIKKGAVTPAKLSTAARKTLTGPQGPTGPQGLKGDKGDRGERGDQGIRGPSDAITKFNSGAVPWSTTYTTIDSVNLGAGSWVVSATGLAVNFEGSPEGANCRLLVGGTTVDASGELFLAAFPQPAAKQAISLTGGSAVAAETTAELQCEGTSANGHVENPAITAIEVGELKTE